MKNTSTVQNVERFGIQKECTFRINASAKAFKILSSGLYSDKITAIMRELSCNAYDAHVEAETLDKPFLVHLPTDLEPYFTIRDFGKGLSDKDIYTVYTTYFESSKTDTNDTIGCLGLGSKSPFCTTDNFSVTSWNGGMKRMYTMFLNEKGIPSVSPVGEEPTTEHSGLEVSFAVKHEEIYEYNRRVQRVYKYFKLQPKFTGHTNISITPVEYTMSKSDWGIRKWYDEGPVLPDQHAYAIMGCVAYPLSDYSEANLTAAERAILDLSINITFEIGELDVAASREKLSYDTITKKNIKEKLTRVAEEITKEFETKIQGCKSLWEARKLIHSLRRGEYKIFNNLLSVGNKNLTWQGQIIYDPNTHTFGNAEYITIKSLQKQVEVYRFGYMGFRRKKARLESNIESIPATPNTVFFYKDVDKNVLVRCVKYIQTQFPNGYSSDTHIILLKEIQPDGIKKFKKLIGMNDADEIANISTLPFDVTITGCGTYNPKNAATILRWLPNTSNRKAHNHWEAVKIDVKNGEYVYVVTDHYRIHGHRPDSYISPYIALLEKIGIKDVVVYGVKIREQERISKKANWKTLTTYTQEKLQEYLKSQNADEAFGYWKEAQLFIDNCYYGSRRGYQTLLDMGVKLFGHRKDMGDFLARLQAIQANATVLNGIIENAEQLEGFANILPYDKKKISEDVEKHFKTIYTTVTTDYPLFTMFEHSRDTTEIMAFKQYIELMDASREKKVENKV